MNSADHTVQSHVGCNFGYPMNVEVVFILGSKTFLLLSIHDQRPFGPRAIFVFYLANNLFCSILESGNLASLAVQTSQYCLAVILQT